MNVIVKQLGEYILSTVGATIFVYKLDSNTLELEQVSFFYAQYYISSIVIIKNYIIFADILSSIHFLVWREEDYSLHFISKDYEKCRCLALDFISDNGKLGFVAAGNVNCFIFCFHINYHNYDDTND